MFVTLIGADYTHVSRNTRFTITLFENEEFGEQSISRRKYVIPMLLELWCCGQEIWTVGGKVQDMMKGNPSRRLYWSKQVTNTFTEEY